MAHSVTLSWIASIDAVDGYNIYRGVNPPGNESTTPLNGTTLVTGTSYTDLTVVVGGNYDYIVTSVKSGIESIHSNESTARILPAPPTNLVAVVT